MSYIMIFVLIGIIILGNFIRKYDEYSKNKGTKVKYLPYLMKPTNYYICLMLLLICYAPKVSYYIKRIKFYIKMGGTVSAINVFYSVAPYFIIFFIYYFVENVCGNVILVNDKFVVFYSDRINLGEVNYVDIFPIKGIFRRRKIDIYVSGKLHTRFSIRNKYTCEVIKIFKDKCIMV